MNFVNVGERTNITGSQTQIDAAGGFEGGWVAPPSRGGAQLMEHQHGLGPDRSGHDAQSSISSPEAGIARVPVMIDSSKWGHKFKCVQRSRLKVRSA
jgi:cobalamin-dependent methionine synthase I